MEHNGHEGYTTGTMLNRPVVVSFVRIFVSVVLQKNLFLQRPLVALYTRSVIQYLSLFLITNRNITPAFFDRLADNSYL